MKNLVVREAYTDKNGAEKVSWNKIGVLFESGDKQYVKLFHMPGILVSVFEQEKKDGSRDNSGESF
jgi:hypothetical protein